MDKETYQIVFAKYKAAENDKDREAALKELAEVLRIQKAYNEAYPPEPPTGIRAILQNSNVLDFARDVVISVIVLKHEQAHIFTSKVGSFVKLRK